MCSMIPNRNSIYEQLTGWKMRPPLRSGSAISVWARGQWVRPPYGVCRSRCPTFRAIHQVQSISSSVPAFALCSLCRFSAPTRSSAHLSYDAGSLVNFPRVQLSYFRLSARNRFWQYRTRGSLKASRHARVSSQVRWTICVPPRIAWSRRKNSPRSGSSPPG